MIPKGPSVANGDRQPDALRLLIVDDDARTRRALAAFLGTRDGMTVIAEASDGKEAIRSIRAQPPDVVLLDVRMPVMGGIEAARLIRRGWPKVKVIILTMYEDSRVQVHAIGVDAFMLKGGSVEDLVETIRSVAAPPRKRPEGTRQEGAIPAAVR